MGLLTKQGPGPWHPAPQAMREERACLLSFLGSCSCYFVFHLAPMSPSVCARVCVLGSVCVSVCVPQLALIPLIVQAAAKAARVAEKHNVDLANLALLTALRGSLAANGTIATTLVSSLSLALSLAFYFPFFPPWFLFFRLLLFFGNALNR